MHVSVLACRGSHQCEEKGFLYLHTELKRVPPIYEKVIVKACKSEDNKFTGKESLGIWSRWNARALKLGAYKGQWSCITFVLPRSICS